MTRVGRGASGGAVTVVNAIATGKGAAIGIDLATRARVELIPDSRDVTLEALIDGEEDAPSDPRLVRACLAAASEQWGGQLDLSPSSGLHVATRSDIPPSRGLKSSSAAANAIILGILDASGVADHADPVEVVRAAAGASVAAGVSVTGAFDDGCACQLGGLAVTDNRERRLLVHDELDPLEVTLLVPRARIETADAGRIPVRSIATLAEAAHRWARRGEWARAMLLNSVAYGSAYGLSNAPVLAALDAGAVAAGVSGTGPAVAVLSRPGDAEPGKAAAARMPDARLLRTQVRNHPVALEASA